MEEIKRVISIDTGQSTQTVKGLKKEISDLKDSLLNTEKGGKQWETTVQQIIAKQEQLNDVTKISKTTNDAAADSIIGMQKQYKALYDTYKLLNEEQRNSDFGKNMAKSLADLHEKLNSTKMAVGNFKDNIGNYTQSAMQAFQQMGISVGALSGPMKVATVASNGLGKSLKALVANPVGAIIMAIVVAFKALEAIVNRVKEAINNNEESQMRLKEAMSAFQPVIDGVSNAFDFLAEKVVSVIGFISEAFARLREIRAAVTDFLGITKGAKERVQEQNQAYRELAKSQNELTKKKREYQKLNAEDEAEVARLREEAENTENLLDKRNLLNQAKDKQAEIDARNVELAQENLRILQEESKHTANDAAMNDKLAKAEADVATARANAAKNARTYDRQLNTVEKTLSKTKDTTEDARKEVEKMDEIIRQSHLSKIQKLEEERDKWIEIYKAAGKATEGVEAYYNAQITNENNRIKNEGIRHSAEIEESYMETIFGANPYALNLVKEYKKQIDDKLAKSGDSSNANEDLRKIQQTFRYKLLEESFPSEDEIKKYAKEYYKDFTDALNNLDYADLKFVSDGLNDDFEDWIEDYRGNIGVYAERGTIYPKISGTIISAYDDFNKVLDNEITRIKLKVAELGEEIAKSGEPINAEQTMMLLNYGSLIENLETLKAQLEEMYNLRKRTMELDKSGYANFDTGNFFGTSTNLNGFIVEGGTKLGRFLKNSEIAWQHWGNAVSTVINTVTSAWQKNLEQKVKNGEMSEEMAEEEFKKVKALQYALAGMNMAAGIVSAFAAPDNVTWYQKIAAAATAAATGAAQMVAISQTQFSGGSSSVGNVGSIVRPQMINDNPYSYTRQVQTDEEREAANRAQRVYVLESDITDAQRKVVVRNRESSF